MKIIISFLLILTVTIIITGCYADFIPDWHQYKVIDKLEKDTTFNTYHKYTVLLQNVETQKYIKKDVSYQEYTTWEINDTIQLQSVPLYEDEKEIDYVITIIFISVLLMLAILFEVKRKERKEK